MTYDRTGQLAIEAEIAGGAQGVIGSHIVVIENQNFYTGGSPIQAASAPASTSHPASLPQLPEFPIGTGEGYREPRTSLEEIGNFLERKAKIKVKNLIKTGELSDVYCGEYGRRKLAIKAFPNSLFPSAVRKKLLAEVDIMSKLDHPSFLRIFDVLFDTHICFIVSDYAEGGKTIAHEIKMKGAKAFSVREISYVLNQLCEAMVEAEAAGLRYLSIIPSQIFVKDVGTEQLSDGGQNEAVTGSIEQRPIMVRLSPINFMLFKSQVGVASPRWDLEQGPFMAPELWRGAKWFKERMEPKLGTELKGDELQRTRLHKSNQFALGMLAWTMLEGRIPMTPNVSDDPEDMKEQFLQDSAYFSARVAEAPWRTKARALGRIIQRMVQHDPAKRWSSMNHVPLIKALAANCAANEVDDLVKKAYQIAGRGNYLFYRSFYERFFTKVPHLRAKFTDMGRQHQMLDNAVGQLLNFREQQSDPTTLTQFVSRHKTLGLSKRDFEEFGNSLIESFDAGLAKEREYQRMMAALEVVIWPGIYFMIQQCTAP